MHEAMQVHFNVHNVKGQGKLETVFSDNYVI